MADEEFLRALFETATADLHAPKVHFRSRPSVVVPLPSHPLPSRQRWPRRAGVATAAAAAGAVCAVITMLGLGVGPTSGRPGGTPTGRATPAGPAVLYRLASTVRALPAPSGRYAVQVEQQREGPTSYLKATIIDSRSGDTWTYQRGAGVPGVLPMAPGFSPSESRLQASYPTDPTRLRTALITQASAQTPAPAARRTPNDLAVTQAINTLWNPLVQPALRAALVSVIATSPGVTTDPHARDSRGRKSIEISYDDRGLGVDLSIYLDPSTGAVLENSERPYTATAIEAGLAGHDIYLSQYWTDASPDTNPLNA